MKEKFLYHLITIIILLYVAVFLFRYLLWLHCSWQNPGFRLQLELPSEWLRREVGYCWIRSHLQSSVAKGSGGSSTRVVCESQVKGGCRHQCTHVCRHRTNQCQFYCSSYLIATCLSPWVFLYSLYTEHVSFSRLHRVIHLMSVVNAPTLSVCSGSAWTEAH